MNKKDLIAKVEHYLSIGGMDTDSHSNEQRLYEKRLMKELVDALTHHDYQQLMRAQKPLFYSGDALDFEIEKLESDAKAAIRVQRKG